MTASVVIAAKTHDVDLWPQRAENSEKPRGEQGGIPLEKKLRDLLFARVAKTNHFGACYWAEGEISSVLSVKWLI